MYPDTELMSTPLKAVPTPCLRVEGQVQKKHAILHPTHLGWRHQCLNGYLSLEEFAVIGVLGEVFGHLRSRRLSYLGRNG